MEAMMKLLQEQSQANERRFLQLEQLVQHAAGIVRATASPDTSLALVVSKSQPRQQEQQDFADHAGTLETFKVTAMAGWPEMPLEEVGHAEKFKAWRQRYSEYVSKCTDKLRTPATMAQSFSKWATWFATAFTEQERQRHEHAEKYGSAFTSLRPLTAVDVLSMPDDEFSKRYLAFCQVKIKDPSQVLQLLSTPKVDVSSGDLVQLMQAAQSFTEQLQLIPKAALQQCEPSQIREAFISSIFGVEQLRERKVDYLKCANWHEACQLMIRKASGASGAAFTPFKPLKGLPSKGSGEKDKFESFKDKGKETSTQADSEDSKPNMSLKTELKWKTRFTDLAEEYNIQKPRHAFAASWKTRYAYLLDCIKQDKKCNRCRRHGHLPSVCPDPLPEVSYPDLSTDQLKRLARLTLTKYDEHGNVLLSNTRGHREHAKQADEREQPVPKKFPTSEHPRHREPSQERGVQQQGPRLSPASSQECYRCGREGHRANECKADTHREGLPLKPRSEGSQSPNSHSR
jgi:hypothetical protein